MSNLKRFLALALVIVMVMTGMAMNVTAAKPTDVEDKGLAYAIDILNRLGVVKGVEETLDDDGNVLSLVFDGDKLVNRQQFALFTARISTAFPDYFKIDEDAPVPKPEKFIDEKGLKDPGYFPAIDYCVKEGIVEGRDDGEFHGEDPVTLQEAIAMLIRSMNYTGLSYPAGYLTKANEYDVRLLGEYAQYSFKGVAPNTELTRTQMAMLLWNYLWSNKVIPTMVYNPTLGTDRLEPVLVPVLELFGIYAMTGYVTAVEGWEATLEKEVTEFDYAVKGDGIKTDVNLFSPNFVDVCISTRPIRSGLGTTASEYEWNKYNRYLRLDKTGLADWLKENEKVPLDLLGVKVTVYEDRERAAEFMINIPVRVDGRKDVIKIDDCDGKWNGDDKKVASLSLPFPAFGEDVKVTAADFVYGDGKETDFLYGFDKDAVLKPFGKNATLENLAKFAGYKANYILECVYNGDTDNNKATGNPGYFYIFRPFEVGYYAKDNDDSKEVQMEVGTKLSGDGAAIGKKAGDATFVGEEWAADEKLTIGNTYLYTLYGKNFEIYEKLTETPKAVVTRVNNSGVTFTELGTKGYGTKALGAMGENPGFAVKGEYKYFVDLDGGMLLARQVDAPEVKFTNSKYVMVLEYVRSLSAFEYGGKAYSGAMIKIWDPAINDDYDIIVTKVDDLTTYDIADAEDLEDLGLYEGAPLKLAVSPGSIVWTQAYTIKGDGTLLPATTKENQFVNVKEETDKTREYYAYTAGELTDNPLSSTMILNLATKGYVSDTAANQKRAIVRSSTKILVYSTDGKVTAITPAALSKLLDNDWEDVSDVVFVSKTPAVGVATNVFLVYDGEAPKSDVNIGKYGVVKGIVDNEWFTDTSGTWWAGEARDGRHLIASDTNLVKDNFIKLASETTATTLGDRYKITVLDTTFNVDAFNKTNWADTEDLLINGLTEFDEVEEEDVYLEEWSYTVDDGDVTVFFGEIVSSNANIISLADDDADVLSSYGKVRYSVVTLKDGKYDKFEAKDDADFQNFAEIKIDDVKVSKAYAVIYKNTDNLDVTYFVHVIVVVNFITPAA